MPGFRLHRSAGHGYGLRRLHHVPAPEEAGNRLRFRGGLDDDKRFGHLSLASALQRGPRPLTGGRAAGAAGAPTTPGYRPLRPRCRRLVSGVLPAPVGPDKLATLRLENAMPPSITSKATPATA